MLLGTLHHNSAPLIALASFLIAWLACRKLRVIESRFVALARRKMLAVIAVGLFALVGRAALLPYMGVPQPVVHDEFSYLLAADTFAHGRLTNPPHPMWIHFETFHEIFQPTYASMYPPAQGMVLAAGKVLTGIPWVGVWFSMAAMCAALCWMLQGWLPPEWALLGGILAALQYSFSGYWINSYWGGAVAGVGGALLLGAWGRLRHTVRLSYALLMGTGLAILANSRPYEGFATSIPVAVWLAIWFFKKRGSELREAIVRIALPLALIVAAVGGAIGYYNWRVTQNPFEMPYQVAIKTYYPEPMFMWQEVKPFPNYHHAIFVEHYEGWLLPFYWQRRSSFVGYLASLYDQRKYARFLLNWGMALPLIMLPWVVRDRRVRLLIVVGLVTGVALLLLAEPFLAHYAAPVLGVILAVVLQGMRHLWVCDRRGFRIGQTFVRAAVLFSLFSAVNNLTPASIREPESDYYHYHTGRAATVQELQQLEGLHLAIVKYIPFHSTHDEWVYNEADIDRSRIVWARDMGADKNWELIQYYPDRDVWLVQPDSPDNRLTPYPLPSAK
jgi:hypothetical protein